MAYWRMSFKVGNRGTSLWPLCKMYGIAAITYYPVVNYDFSKYSKLYLPDDWNELQPMQKANLKHFAFDFMPGDIIYVKEGLKIACKGVVKSKYFYDKKNRIIDENGFIWPHQVEVEWDKTFIEIDFLLGAEPITVYQLSEEQVMDIENIEFKVTKEKIKREIFSEGEVFREEYENRTRNIDLITKKKCQSDYKCIICGFSFAEKYGEIGIGYIEAHHLVPISDGKRVSTLDDIALVCSNCHSMIHRKKPPYTIEELKRIMKLG